MIRYTLILFLIVSSISCTPKYSKFTLQDSIPNVLIGEGRRAGTGPCEPSIFVSPVNPKYIIAGAVLDNVYRSEDGGKSWTKDILKSSLGVFGDPVISADSEGAFYYLHLSDPSGKGWRGDQLLDRIVIQRSDDNGKSWNDGGFAGMHHPKDQDKPWIAIEPENNHLYITWTEFDKYGSQKSDHKSRILFSKSTDKGENWSDAIAINELDGDCLDDDDTVEGAVPAIGPNGEVYVSWAYNEKIYFDRSKDGGKTWLEEDILAADQPGGWVFEVPGISRTNGLPVTAADHSEGPHRGNIYINWSDQRNGEEDTDVWLTRSTDGGDIWSEPLRVNNDKAGKHNFLTWMCVDPVSGYVYIVFYDRRDHEDNRTDVYLAYSTDGGASFINQKISDAPFLPNRYIFFGDYNNISAYDGVVRPIWTRYDNGKLSVWTALIDLK